ncbi:MAG: ribonuclease P protein component [Candidatus Saccharibacteria bacterium]
MIDRSHRFHGNNSLRAVYRRAQTLRATSLSLKYAPNHRPAGYRAAVVVSRKVSHSAVVRNRIRRRLYEIIRRTADPSSPSDLIVTVFGAELARLPAAQLAASVSALLTKAAVVPPTGVDRAIVKTKEESN